MPRKASASLLCKPLQSSSNAPIIEQGCAGIACHPDRGPHSAAASPGRIASPICPDLVSGRDVHCAGVFRGRRRGYMLFQRLLGWTPMRHWQLVLFAATVAFAEMAMLPSMARAQTVDAAIALAADVSRSIDDEEFQLQRRGYAAAITDPRFMQAIKAGTHGAIALCFLEWAGSDQLAVVAKWMVIRDGNDAAKFAKILLDAPRSSAGRTAIGAGIDFAVTQLEADGVSAERRIIDVSGDGSNNSGRLVTEARDEAVAKGITINGLAIINEKTSGEPGTFRYVHTHPPGGLPNYYRDNVIGGPGAFVLQIVNFDTFAEAMTNKLLTEISDASPHSLRRAVSKRPPALVRYEAQ